MQRRALNVLTLRRGWSIVHRLETGEHFLRFR
jgi:hypothetical protein